VIEKGPVRTQKFAQVRCADVIGAGLVRLGGAIRRLKTTLRIAYGPNFGSGYSRWPRVSDSLPL
jgi:NAD dependent epimerase/dehydratase family enzyme